MAAPYGNNITRLLQELKENHNALESITPILYNELRVLASKYLRGEYGKRTIQTTELVHEAYLKLIGGTDLSLENRRDFFCIAANSMRQILVDNSRKRNAAKRGGGATKIYLDEAPAISAEINDEILALDEALSRLAIFDKRLCRVVELKYFSGLQIEEIAEALSVSPTTVKRDWSLAKAWLYRELEKMN